MTVKTELWQLTASETAALVKSRKVSAHEVAEAALKRLEAVNPAINAVVEYRPEDVLNQAKTVDTAIEAGKALGPLAGVPVTIKVLADQTGYASTNGLKTQKDLIAKCNNPVVQSFIDAGAILLGRTNTPAFSYRWFTNNLVHGHTHNPRQRSLTPGGSSGGAGAAVASGIGAIAHGTDIGGSIRYPAYACGVHGLRPSFGRVAYYNASGKDRNIGGQIMSVSGPLARSVEDVRLGLEVMSRPDVHDPWWVPAPLYGPTLSKRAALCLHPEGTETAPEIVETLISAAEMLREAGWVVEEVESLPPLKAAADIQKTLWLGDGYQGMLDAAYAEGDPGAIAVLEGQGKFVEGLEPNAVAKALVSRVSIVRQWVQFTEQYPLVLMPISSELPFEDNLDLKSAEDFDRVWAAQLSMIGLPVTGLPGMSVCTGLLQDGTPLGVQLVSGRFREDICLQAAEAIEARSPRVAIAEPTR